LFLLYFLILHGSVATYEIFTDLLLISTVHSCVVLLQTNFENWSISDERAVKLQNLH